MSADRLFREMIYHEQRGDALQAVVEELLQRGVGADALPVVRAMRNSERRLAKDFREQYLRLARDVFRGVRDDGE